MCSENVFREQQGQCGRNSVSEGTVIQSQRGKGEVKSCRTLWVIVRNVTLSLNEMKNHCLVFEQSSDMI